MLATIALGMGCVAGIGCIRKDRRSKILYYYKGHTEDVCKESLNRAINDEIASYEELDGIYIMKDAMHGWRKNSKDTSSYGMCACH